MQLIKVIILAILMILITGCSKNTISGTKDLILNKQDLSQLGLTASHNETELQFFGMNGTNCQTDESYTNIVDSSQGQYSICIYTLNNTEIIIELQKFANLEALDGSYQYSSLHLYSIQGLISENTYGDQSRFRVNNVNDYGGEYNDPNIYYYHLWITKDLYLIHITSSGSSDVKEYIPRIGLQILSKFR